MASADFKPDTDEIGFPRKKPWTDRNVPLATGSGASPPQESLHGTTPSKSDKSEGGKSKSSKEKGGDGSSPADQEPSGRSPHIGTHIPDKPPDTGMRMMPIPSSGQQMMGSAVKIGQSDIINMIVGKAQAAGLNATAIQGILGSVQQESHFDPTATSSAGAYGLFQHLGVRLHGSGSLSEYAQSKGMPVSDPGIQTDFALQEMQKMNGGRFISEMNASGSPQAAATMFTGVFERPGKSEANMPARLQGALNFAQQGIGSQPTRSDRDAATPTQTPWAAATPGEMQEGRSASNAPTPPSRPDTPTPPSRPGQTTPFQPSPGVTGIPGVTTGLGYSPTPGAAWSQQGGMHDISGKASDIPWMAGGGSQPVTPGQTDPHKPGFDPSSVPFHHTPEMASQPPNIGPAPGAPNIGPAPPSPGAPAGQINMAPRQGDLSSPLPLRSSATNVKDLNPGLLGAVTSGANAFMAQNPGFKVQVNEGYNASGHVQNSLHHSGRAMDIQIMGPDGTPIPNEGPDTTGMYRKLATSVYGNAPPGVKGQLGWGGAFGTVNNGKVQDLMHFDLGGDRGNLAPNYRLSALSGEPQQKYTMPEGTNPASPNYPQQGGQAQTFSGGQFQQPQQNQQPPPPPQQPTQTASQDPMGGIGKALSGIGKAMGQQSQVQIKGPPKQPELIPPPQITPIKFSQPPPWRAPWEGEDQQKQQQEQQGQQQ